MRISPNVGGGRTLPTPFPSRRFVVRCQSSTDSSTQKKVVVVGGGWAGFGAAKALTEQGYAVTLLDASPNLGGVSTGWRNKNGRPLEAGTKGFWWDYPNIYSLLKNLDIEWPLTPFLTSAFWGPGGELITEAPVFSEKERLPTLIGQFVYTNPLFYGLPLVDRLSILPWLYNVINIATADAETYEKYDQMSACELFRLFGVTEKAYELFLKPTLAVGLFAPPEQLSAAAVLDTLAFYALNHQQSFDVCWAKGSISEVIFQPLVNNIEAQGGQIKAGRLVTGVDVDETGAVRAVVASSRETGSEEVYPTDAVVLAISVEGMKKLVQATPELGSRREFQNIMNLGSIDCIATRIWFDRPIPTRFPANVLAGFEQDVGATYFNLSEMQKDEFKNEPGTVIAADFYGASSLLPLSDEAIISKVQRNMALCEPAFASAQIIDSDVLRFPRAVTHFSPGSHRNRPYQQTSIPNLVIAGDYVKGLNHGANGLSQERAYVTGLAAANLIIEQCGQGRKVEILPVEPDEAHIAAAKEVNKQIQGTLKTFGFKLPFLP